MFNIWGAQNQNVDRRRERQWDGSEALPRCSNTCSSSSPTVAHRPTKLAKDKLQPRQGWSARAILFLTPSVALGTLMLWLRSPSRISQLCLTLDADVLCGRVQVSASLTIMISLGFG